MKKIRVLVVDDSALMRKLISRMLESDPDIEVVGTALDGQFALNKIDELRPDVITLDLEMPRMDGVETLRAIMRRQRVPVVVVSAHSTEGASVTFKALQLGAIDFITKPQDALSENMDAIAAELINKIKAAAEAGPPRLPHLAAATAAVTMKSNLVQHTAASKVVAIGISTGGPNALQYLLSQFPPDFPGGMVIVQHMPEGFTGMFARRLDECSSLMVKEAHSGDVVAAGRVLVCPGNRHMKLRRSAKGTIVVLSDEAPINGHRPSVDVLFRSLAHEVGSESIAVLMTGMGEDGADAMGEVKLAGGMTIAQQGDSCVVYGMPRAAIERGHARRIVGLENLAAMLQALCTARTVLVKSANPAADAALVRR